MDRVRKGNWRSGIARRNGCNLLVRFYCVGGILSPPLLANARHGGFGAGPIRTPPPVNGDPNPPLHGDALFSGMKNASRQKAQEPGQEQAAVFCGLA